MGYFYYRPLIYLQNAMRGIGEVRTIQPLQRHGKNTDLSATTGEIFMCLRYFIVGNQ